MSGYRIASVPPVPPDPDSIQDCVDILTRRALAKLTDSELQAVEQEFKDDANALGLLIVDDEINERIDHYGAFPRPVNY